MKSKKIWVLSILLVIVVVIIFWVYPKIVLLNAVIKFSNIDSIHVEGTVTLNKDNSEVSLVGNANYSNNILSAKLSTNSVWNLLQAELYLDTKNSKFYLTTNFSEDWYYSKSNNTMSNSFKIERKDIHFKKVISDRKGESKYQITLEKETFLTLLSSYLKNSDSENDKVIIYLYIKDGNISGIQVKDKIILSKEDSLYLSNIDITFSSWNRISTITIPDEILENSKEIENNVLEMLFS